MHNQITILGNLTRDIELKYSGGGMAIASTGIASTKKFTSNGEKKEEVLFVDLTFFGKSAEIANSYLRKGSKCLIAGRLKLDSWTDQQGQKRSKHSVIVENMTMLDSKSDTQPQSNSHDNHNVNNPQVTHENIPAQQPSYQQASMEYDAEDDLIPF